MSTVITWEDDGGAAQTLELDADLQEAHDLGSDITEHPVEEGADVTDHVRPRLRRVTIEGYVTDTPMITNPGVAELAEFKTLELQIPPKPQQISLSAGLAAGIGAISDALFGPTPPPKATILTLADAKSRKRAVYDALEDIRLNARFCRVLTSLHEYDNMLIEQVVPTRTPGSGTGATFVVTFKEVRQVSSDVTVAPVPAETLGAPKKAAGAKNKNKDEGKAEEKKKKVLKSIWASGIDLITDAL
jgi:hypothetical protein